MPNKGKDSGRPDRPRLQDDEVREFQVRIADTVNALRGGGSISALARKIGYSRSNFHTLLTQTADEKQRGWSMHTLLGVARALGVQVWELIYLAENPDASIFSPDHVDGRIAELEAELELLRKRRRLNEISARMRELSEEWSALRDEKRELEGGYDE